MQLFRTRARGRGSMEYSYQHRLRFYGRHRYKEKDLIFVDDWRVDTDGLSNIVNQIHVDMLFQIPNGQVTA